MKILFVFVCLAFVAVTTVRAAPRGALFEEASNNLSESLHRQSTEVKDLTSRFSDLRVKTKGQSDRARAHAAESEKETPPTPPTGAKNPFSNLVPGNARGKH
ncbi:uncharacterized protein SPSC_06150 [Sporisorium scitamineum]|uniref:Uncharacterized protein n=1 Tax=Sporisorium scitamineum TaxID=49012 RepID=A0A127ZIQ3_9BASI|nr:uncharacterized protein SPSC_06150 [Sporisorium scitamineum]